MSNSENQGGFCKTVCWLIGIGLGGYLGYALFTDFGVEMVQAAVYGIVTMLLTGLLFRKLFCHGKGGKVKARQEELRQSREAEGEIQSESEAKAILDNAAAAVKAEKPGFSPASQQVETLNADLEERVNAVADEISVPGSTAKDIPPAVEETTAEPTESTKAKTGKSKSTKSTSSNSSARKSTKSKTSTTKSTGSKKSSTSKKAKSSGSGSSKSAPVKEPIKQDDVLSAEAKEAITSMKEAASPLSAIVAETLETREDGAGETAAPAAPEPKTAESAETASAKDQPEVAAIKPLEPKGLETPENGTPDDLSQLAGIGEEQIQALHAAGIYHFSQFVSMNRRELAWLDQNISGSPEAAPSGEWRKQAIQIVRKAG